MGKGLVTGTIIFIIALTIIGIILFKPFSTQQSGSLLEPDDENSTGNKIDSGESIEIFDNSFIEDVDISNEEQYIIDKKIIKVNFDLFATKDNDEILFNLYDGTNFTIIGEIQRGVGKYEDIYSWGGPKLPSDLSKTVLFTIGESEMSILGTIDISPIKYRIVGNTSTGISTITKYNMTLYPPRRL